MQKTVNNNLKEIRKDRKLTKAALAIMTGVDKSTISRIESGQVPTLETALKVAKALRVRVERIFWLDAPP